jgi:hypothetical protein
MSTWPTDDNYSLRRRDGDIHVLCARCDCYSEVFSLPRGRFDIIRVAMEAHDACHEVISKAKRGEAVSALELGGLVADFEPGGPA